MGTRSLTLFFNNPKPKGKKEVPFAVMYTQYDGYPDGLGKELAEFLVARKRINGISGETSANAANGPGCLAAQVVTHFKSDASKKIQIGGVYLQEYNPKGWQEYEYEVRPDDVDLEARPKTKDGGWYLTVFTRGLKRRKLFEGTPKEFLTALKEKKFEED